MLDHCFANRDQQQHRRWLKRFDPEHWTIDFPRPMMAGLTTHETGLRIDAVFYRSDDLAGLIWWSEDRQDHPLIAYETNRDYRQTVLRFRWRSGGIRRLDAVHGPTLTIEGRDAAGNLRAWYVRLWNYAEGQPEDARITIDFEALEGGFTLPAEGDRVWAGDIDRIFLSLVAPGYDGSANPLPEPAQGWVELSEWQCEGPGSVLAQGDAFVPPHGLAIATGYDDAYHLSPARLLRNAFQLGYRGAINHYVGMSHYFRLVADEGRWVVDAGGEGPLNSAARSWHLDFARRATALDYSLILSLSYELLADHCPLAWQQRDAGGAPARTGWVPASALLSPAHDGAMAYLGRVAEAFVSLAVQGGQTPRFQIGEAWWWVTAEGRICLYDDAAREALGGDPIVIDDLRQPQNAAACSLLDQAGLLLAQSTSALFDQVRSVFPDTERLLLIFLPTVLDPAMPEARRANLPSGWAWPAADILQIEDYDWVTGERVNRRRAAIAHATQHLGYETGIQHYLAGFVLDPANRFQWRSIIEAAAEAQARAVGTIILWALPQVMRDGLVVYRQGEEQVDSFDDVVFPLPIGLHARVTPGFSTQIVSTAAGHERRNIDWASGRLRFDAGLGVRSEADMGTLLSFFRARRGAAKGFRFRDPIDSSSNGLNQDPTPHDQILGTGDGVRVRFGLSKRYGEGHEVENRPITRPVETSVLVAVGGTPLTSGWGLEARGMVLFDDPPPEGALVTAGFRFDVPCRFEEDQIDIALPRFRAGEALSVPLIEIREAR